MASPETIAAAKTYLLGEKPDRSTAVHHYNVLIEAGFSSAELQEWYLLVRQSGKYGLITRSTSGEVTFDSRRVTAFKVGTITNSATNSEGSLNALILNEKLEGYISVGTLRRVVPHSGNPVPFAERGLYTYVTDYVDPSTNYIHGGYAMQIRSLDASTMTAYTGYDNGQVYTVTGPLVDAAIGTDAGIYDILTYGENS